MSNSMKIKYFCEQSRNQLRCSLCLNEMLGASLRLASAGPCLRTSKIAPGDFVRKNLASSLSLFARFLLSFVPSMQYAG